MPECPKSSSSVGWARAACFGSTAHLNGPFAWKATKSEKGSRMGDWLRIRYGEFWDVPRLFAVEHEPPLLFSCRFSDMVDEYADSYDVYRIANLPEPTDLAGAEKSGVRLGEVPVATVVFDPSRRESIDASVLVPFQAWLGEAAPSPWWDQLGGKRFHLRVEFTLLSTGEGGRRTPIGDGYRSQSWFGDTRGDERVFYDCVLHIEPGADASVNDVRLSVAPGGRGTGALVPILEEEVRELAPAGTAFEMCEGLRTVANGTVTEVVESEL